MSESPVAADELRAVTRAARAFWGHFWNVNLFTWNCLHEERRVRQASEQAARRLLAEHAEFYVCGNRRFARSEFEDDAIAVSTVAAAVRDDVFFRSKHPPLAPPTEAARGLVDAARDLGTHAARSSAANFAVNYDGFAIGPFGGGSAHELVLFIAERLLLELELWGVSREESAERSISDVVDAVRRWANSGGAPGFLIDLRALNEELPKHVDRVERVLEFECTEALRRLPVSDARTRAEDIVADAAPTKRRAKRRARIGEEVKAHAVDLIAREGLTPAQAAERLGVGRQRLYEWPEVKEAIASRKAEDDLMREGVRDALRARRHQ